MERSIQLLNGWWDLQPVAHADLAVPIEPHGVPETGWQAACYLVPGFFTDHPYPEAWRAGRSAWVRRLFEVNGARLATQRAMLALKAAIPKAWVYLNGRLVTAQEDMFIGDEHDVTPFLQPGRNELAVLLTEFKTFPHPGSGKLSLIDVPWGCCIAGSQAGLWQDVQLEWRAPVHVADVTIRTSTRENSLTVIAQVTNAGAAPFEGLLTHEVQDESGVVLALLPLPVSVRPGETRDIEQMVSWTGYRPWFPESPHLYRLRSCLSDAQTSRDGRTETDELETRFGFREVWIEGPRILLNGRPQRWYGEWCHKSHTHWLRPEYVRQWYRMLKDLGMNYVRMHTFPHPDYFLDIADEMGILVCQESPLYGSGPAGWDTPDLWRRATDNVRRIIRRDKNHPSLLIYSVENEMRWSLNIVPSAKVKLPELRALYTTLDPTRPAYHEGDTSLWNEDREPILSRHYGAACHGLGWWDKRVPLSAGEIGRWHYASPYHALQWAGDAVFADYRHLSESLARDCARIVELGRANEVSCLFCWNISGLDNFRPAEARTFSWSEPESRYAKPLAHKPYESEFAWWEGGSGYRPGFSFELLRQAFRPLAIVIREERSQFYSDRRIRHTVHVVNDLPTVVQGVVSVRLEQAGTVLWEQQSPLAVSSGCTGTVKAEIDLAAVPGCAGWCTVSAVFASPQSTDRVERPVNVTPRRATLTLAGLTRLAMVGRSTMTPWLRTRGVAVSELADPSELDVAKTPVAIVAERTAPGGPEWTSALHGFVSAGGRVLVLEQEQSLLPGLSVARQPIEMAFVRDSRHPVTAGITDHDLRFFGDDPFGLPSSDAWVTVKPYGKPRDTQLVRVLVDSSGGDFGGGGLTWAPVIEAEIGKGTVIASQLRLTDRLDELPVAERLLTNTLRYLAGYAMRDVSGMEADEAMGKALEQVPHLKTTRGSGVHLVSGNTAPVHSSAEWQAILAAGGTLLVWGLTDAARPAWEGIIGRRIDLFVPDQTVFQLVSGARMSPLLAGVSNEDTCWLENWTYTQTNRKEPIVERLLDVDGGIVHLRNAARSGLDRLFGVESPNELTRMVWLSEFQDRPLPRVGGGLVEVPVGSGRVIFCQVLWKPDLWQFRRLLGMLLWNVGVAHGTDVLSAHGASAPEPQGVGYPGSLRVAAGDAEALDEVLSLGKRRAESYAANMPFREWARWQAIPIPEGRLTATCVGGDGARVIGMEVNCPEPRKFMETIGGLPNPDLQTFLRLQGGGTVRAWVNGVEWGRCELKPDTAAYIADIDFEAGANFVVLLWEPAGETTWCSLRFENKDRRAETTFGFA